MEFLRWPLLILTGMQFSPFSAKVVHWQFGIYSALGPCYAVKINYTG